MKYWIQILTGLTLFIFSSLVTWYEGSELLNNPWEWEHSAIFSKALDRNVLATSDIVDLDHFVYAAKFRPVYPTIMVLSLVYLLSVVGIVFFRNRSRAFSAYYSILGACLLLVALSMFPTTTSGMTMITSIVAGLGVGSIGFSLYWKAVQINKT